MVSTPNKHDLNTATVRPDDWIIRPVYSVRKKPRFSAFGEPNRELTPISNRWKRYPKVENIIDGQFDDALEEDSWFIGTSVDGSEATNAAADNNDQRVKEKTESNEYSSKVTFPVEAGKGIQTKAAAEKSTEEKKVQETNNFNGLGQNSMITPARRQRRQSQTTKTLLSDPLLSSPEEDSSRVPVPESTDTFSLFGTSLMKNAPSAFSNNSFGSCLSNEHHILRDLSVNSSAMSATPSHGLICVTAANLQSPATHANMPKDSTTKENRTPERKHATLVNTSEKKKKRECEGNRQAESEDSPEDDKIYLETLQGLTSSRRLSRTPCSCTRSRCLKLYCDCFQRGLLCDSTTCKCLKCRNTEKYSSPNGARTVAIKLALMRRPSGFEKKKVKNVEHGCCCKKNRCLQLYCICKLNNVPCSAKCKCFNCHNLPGARKKSNKIDDGLPDRVPKGKIKDMQTSQVKSESIDEGAPLGELEEV